MNTLPTAELSTRVALGAAMCDPGAAEHILRELPVEAFDDVPAHLDIYAAIRDCWENHGNCDVVLVAQELLQQGHLERACGASYLDGLKDEAAGAALRDGSLYLDPHVDAVRKAWRLREADRACARIRGRVHGGADLHEVQVELAAAADAIRGERARAEGLRIVRLGEVAQDEAAARWLVEGLWTEGGMGVLGGEPKTSKSILLLDLAVAVASGQAFLGRAVPTAGPALLFAAEDPLRSVASRLRRICRARGLDQAALPVHLVNESLLRLDDASQRERLRQAVMRIRPRMIGLDPFRRLLAGDENDAAVVAPLLGELRALGRDADCAIVVVHHFRKRSGADFGGRTAERLRGSGDIFAAGDCYWLVSQSANGIRKVEVELREVPAPEAFEFRVEGQPGEPLRVVAVTEADHERETDAAVLAALDAGALGVRDLREAVHEAARERGERGARNQDVDAARRRLVAAGRLVERKEGRKLVIELSCPGGPGTLGHVGHDGAMEGGGERTCPVPRALGGTVVLHPFGEDGSERAPTSVPGGREGGADGDQLDLDPSHGPTSDQAAEGMV